MKEARTVRCIVVCALALALGGATATAQERESGDDGRPAPGGMGRPMLPGGPEMRLRVFGGFMDVIEQITRMARDPSAAGVAAALSAGDILRKQGSDKMVDYFTKVLPDVKNTAVKNAIRLQLVEAYKTGGQQDKALDLLRQVMTEAPAGSEPPPPPPNR
jgi:hypothetical protein